jgi:hypothetical protein
MSPNTAITLKSNFSVTPNKKHPSPGLRFLAAITVVALNALQARAEDAETNGKTLNGQATQTGSSHFLFGLILIAAAILLLPKDERDYQRARGNGNDPRLRLPRNFPMTH